MKIEGVNKLVLNACIVLCFAINYQNLWHYYLEKFRYEKQIINPWPIHAII